MYIFAAFAVVALWLSALSSSFERLSSGPGFSTPIVLATPVVLPRFSEPVLFEAAEVAAEPAELVESVAEPAALFQAVEVTAEVAAELAEPVEFFDEVAAFRAALTAAAPLLTPASSATAAVPPLTPSFSASPTPLLFPAFVQPPVLPTSVAPSAPRVSLPNVHYAQPVPVYGSGFAYSSFFSPPQPFLVTPLAPEPVTPIYVPVTVVVVATLHPTPTVEPLPPSPTPSPEPEPDFTPETDS
jgi:hypothetical protein